MPTVLRFDGLRVVIYPNDHRPAHVHMIGRGHEAVFDLNCPAGPVEGELWILQARDQAHRGCLDGSPGRVVPGLGANSWHCVTISNWQTSVLRVSKEAFHE
ncbi:MAG: DUF4160 domain-containing protein [Bryobacteraceae bacterium]